MLNRDRDSFAPVFARIDFSGRRQVLAAVSGGSDSLALLLSLNLHLKQHRPEVALHAATVDHRLRAESADEARAVAALCAERRIPHATLAWEGEKPAAGLPAAAREARYRLLAQAADDAGAGLVLTAHTLDDQAETVAMRAARGEGRGLAGMAEATLYRREADRASLWIMRPFLGLRRAALRGWLQADGTSWLDDPGNANPRAERVRVRAGMTEPEATRWAVRAEAEARRRRALGEEAARLIDSAASSEGDAVRVRLDALADGDAGLYALRLLLAAVGRREQLPDVARSAALLVRLAEGPPLRATLGGVLLATTGGTALLRRERRGPPRGATGPAAPWPRFLPGFDLAPAMALGRLFGLADLPPVPLIPHLEGRA